MKVLVDTSVWSLAFRRRRGAETPVVQELRSLVGEGRVAMIGPIRQELLSGIRSAESFERLRDHLRPYPDEQLDSADFEPVIVTAEGRALLEAEDEFRRQHNQ
jgi:hypothetical protein